jgi:hypothetical protein
MRRPLFALLALALALPAWGAEPSVSQPLRSARPTLDFSVGYRGFSRTFGLDSPATTVPRFGGTGGGVAVEAAVYPFASVSSSVLGNLGLLGEGQLSVGLSALYNGKDFAAEATTLRGSLALRVPFDASEVLLQAGVGYQGFRLATASTDGRGTLAAQADPGFLGPRAGLGYQLRVTERLSLRARAALLFTLSRGQLGSLYTQSSAFGLDAGVQLAFTLVSAVQLRASADWSRVFLTLAPGLTATEQQFGGTVSVALAL